MSKIVFFLQKIVHFWNDCIILTCLAAVFACIAEYLQTGVGRGSSFYANVRNTRAKSSIPGRDFRIKSTYPAETQSSCRPSLPFSAPKQSFFRVLYLLCSKKAGLCGRK